MAYTLQNIRDYVWSHLDLDADEISTFLIDTWAREATIRIANSRVRWPFFEQDWELTTVAGTQDYSFDGLSPAVDEITSVLGDERRLTWIGRDEGERRYLPVQQGHGNPTFFSTWASKLRFYPAPAGEEILFLRGYRKVSDWVSGGAGSEPDFPDDFHDLVRLYVLASCYAQQEDTQMSQMYRDHYNEELDRLKKMYGDAPQAYPLVIGSGPRTNRPNRPMFPFEF